MKRRSIWWALVLVLVAIGAGFWLQQRGSVTTMAGLDSRLQERLLRANAPTFGVSSARVTIVGSTRRAKDAARFIHM